MKRIAFLSCLLAGFFLAACDHASEHRGHSEHNAAAELPQLDHGRRWPADAPTREGFAKIRLIVPRELNPGEGLDAYNARATRIIAELDAVFAACKMTGAGHTELHKFIALLLQDLKPMRGKDLESARDAQKKLSEDLDQFAVYFE